MKKAILVLCGIMALSLTACNGCKCKERKHRRFHAPKHMKMKSERLSNPEFRERMRKRFSKSEGK